MALALSVSAMGASTAMSPVPGHFGTATAAFATSQIEAANANEQRVDASTLVASPQLKEAMIEEEGVRETVYRDVAGYPTVGVGHLVTKADNLRLGQRISYDRILDLLDQDLGIAERAAQRLLGDLPVHQHEFDALVDLIFNVGEGNVSRRESPRLNAAIDRGDYEAIADELHYHHAAGSKARGLVYRSERRSNIFLEAAYEDPRELASSSRS